MEKANVMKAMELCNKMRATSCLDCPYYGDENQNCKSHLLGDALALLKADEKANEKPTYSMAIIFTKRDNLLKWFSANDGFWALGTKAYQRARDVHAEEREVRLILLVRFNEKGKPICRIKCPINPLPIKGEFEAPTVGAVSHTLETMGWTYKEKLPLGLFK
nr:MAG TPA: hypothetical protein [Caudoviricetes sp.]